MSTTSLVLSVIMTVAFTLMMAPSVIAMNRGKTLRNIAIWLAVFAGLGLIYKNFGPESAHPLFGLPPGVAMRVPQDGNTLPAHDDKPGEEKINGTQGFTPPGE